MTMWLVSGTGVDSLASRPEIRDGDRLIRAHDAGFEVGVVRRDREPMVEWVGQLERSLVPVDRVPDPASREDSSSHAELPEVEAILHGADRTTPGEGGLPGTGPPPPI